jgi:hypothetical protein
MPAIEDEVMQDLLKRLEGQDEVLQATDRSFQLAKASMEMATAQYAAIRDLVTRRLGYSPYAVEDGVFVTDDVGRQKRLRFPTKGRFRFTNMAPGDAAISALGETTEPMALDELVSTLRAGGITGSRESLTRAVNAALMRKSGIGRADDGRYFREDANDYAVLREARGRFLKSEDEEEEDED